MVESHQLSWRAQSAARDGQQIELCGPPFDDPQFTLLLSRVRSAVDVHSFWSIFRSMLDEVVSSGCTGEQIALLARLHPHIEMTLQRLSTQEDRAAREYSSGDFAERAPARSAAFADRTS
jgi:hypothetical protein